MNYLSRLLLAPFLVLRGRPKKPPKYIPDDIIIKIFNLCDAKSIANCCLVSRRFRQLAVQTEHLSLQISYSIGNGESAVPVPPRELLQSLQRFSRIRFAKIEFFCDAPNPNNNEQMPDSLLRWKHGPQGSITLFAKKFFPSLDDDDEGDCSVIAPNDLTEEHRETSFGWLANSQLHRALWIHHITRIVNVLPNVQEVTAVDSRMQGCMIVDGGHIDFMRGTSPPEDVTIQVKVWIAYHVKVPFSEYVLKDVIMYLIRLNDVPDDLVVQNLCEEVEFCQTAMRIMAEIPTCEDSHDLVTNYHFF